MTITRNHTHAERLNGANSEPGTPWSTEKLYTRSHEYRRILLLEAIAHVIVRMESFQTREEFEAFAAELRETREQAWGRRPWPHAKDPDGYLEHVADLAREFADANGSVDYASRSIAS